MKSDKLVPGLILVMIGGVFLLHSFGYIHLHWPNLIHLWPMLLIIAGVNLVFAHNRSGWATVLKVAVVVLGFGLLIFGNFGKSYSFPFYYYNYHNNDNDDDSSSDNNDDDTTGNSGIVKVEGNSDFNMPLPADAHVAQLNINGGGSSYTLNDTTNQLFKADTKEFFGKYEFSHRKDDSIYVLDFKMKNHKGHFDWGDHDKSNTADFKLNLNPIWNIDVETGAAALNFDLSKFKIKSFVLKGGAGSFDIKFGLPQQRTDVNVTAGASSVDITIPQNAACDIESNTGLASNSFDGFDKQDDGHYQTPGFASAKNKMYITIRGGVGSFDVHRE
jgi:hypothetical protein